MTTESCYRGTREYCPAVNSVISQYRITASVAYTDQVGHLIDWNGEVVRYPSEEAAIAAVREAAGE